MYTIQGSQPWILSLKHTVAARLARTSSSHKGYQNELVMRLRMHIQQNHRMDPWLMQLTRATQPTQRLSALEAAPHLPSTSAGNSRYYWP